MYLFLLAYVVVYGSMQAVVFLRLRPLLPEAGWTGPLLGLFLACMVLCPIAAHLLDASGREAPASAIAWIGYSWMGFVFLAFCLGIALFCLEGGLHLAGRWLPALPAPPSGRGSAIALLAVALALSCYGHIRSRDLRVERVELQAPAAAAGLRIVQISDLHLGLLAGKQRAAEIVREIERIDPDLLVSTGDLVDGGLQGLMRAAPLFRGLNPPLGKYAVTGNHESYLPREGVRRFLQRCGFTLLEDRAVLPGKGLRLAGMDYGRAKRCGTERAVLGTRDAARFTILLKHDPRVCPESRGLFDLQLSGHTHRGQIFPFTLAIRAVYAHVSGLYRLDWGSSIYVSSGTGTWGPQMRLGTSRELTVLEIGEDRP
jgi:hypothetical protein